MISKLMYTPPAESLVVCEEPPTDAEKQQLLEALCADEDALAMAAAHQQGFQTFLFELDRKLPALNTKGRPVKGNMRGIPNRK